MVNQSYFPFLMKSFCYFVSLLQLMHDLKVTRKAVYTVTRYDQENASRWPRRRRRSSASTVDVWIYIAISRKAVDRFSCCLHEIISNLILVRHRKFHVIIMISARNIGEKHEGWAKLAPLFLCTYINDNICWPTWTCFSRISKTRCLTAPPF